MKRSEVEENLQEPANSVENALDDETVELAQADTPKAEENSSSNQSSSPSSGAEAAATGPSSIFGSVAMVPVAAVGIQQVVEKVTESSSAPIEAVDITLPRIVTPIEVTPAIEPLWREPIQTPVISEPFNPPVVPAEPIKAFQGSCGRLRRWSNSFL